MTIIRADAAPTPDAKRAVGFFGAAGQAPEPQAAKALQDQVTAFALFCKRQGYEPVTTFHAGPVDENGGDPYARMLKYLRRDGGVTAVVVKTLDAINQDREDLALAVLELNDLGTKVQLMDGQVVDPFTVVSGIWPRSAEPAERVRERIKAAMRSRAIKGEGLGKPPYGYRIGPSRKLEVVPDEAQTVKLIYTLYTQQDQGIRLIVRHLNEHHIPTRKGRNWSMVTIRDILRNRAYLGTYSRFGLRVPGSHPAIVTPDMFRWTQARLEERRPSRKNNQAEPFLLSGLVYCGYCGNRMVGVTRRQAWTRRKDGTKAEKEYRYYQCQSRTNQGVCKYHTRKDKDLESVVVEHLRTQKARIAALKGPRGLGSPAAMERERKRLETARERIEARLRRNIKQVADGRLSLQKFRPLSAELLASRRELLHKLDRLEDLMAGDTPPLSAGQQAANAIESLASSWDTLEFDQKRLLFQGLLDRVDVFDDRFTVQLRADLAEGT